MDFYSTRGELRRMGINKLLKMATNQKIQKCIIINNTCRFHFRYRNFNFCVSEIIGESCEIERLDKLEEIFQRDDETIFLRPLLRELELGPVFIEKKTSEFKVYWRNRITHSVTFLGRVTERRKKERRNNFTDLLKRAIKDFSDQVKDPSGIFLLGS